MKSATFFRVNAQHLTSSFPFNRQSALSRTAGVISKYEKDQTVPSVLVAKEIAKALDVSLDFLIDSEKALFIDDHEIINLLKGYNSLNEEVKDTMKNMLKALNIYSNVKGSVN